jgi:hypothetical protein
MSNLFSKIKEIIKPNSDSLKIGERVSIQKPIIYGHVIELGKNELIKVKLDNGSESIYPKEWLKSEKL